MADVKQTNADSDAYKMALELIRAHAPQELANTQATIKEGFAYGAKGITRYPIGQDPDITVRTPNRYTTPEVMDLVATILHEVTHAQQRTGKIETDRQAKPGELTDPKDLVPSRVMDLGTPQRAQAEALYKQLTEQALKIKMPSVQEGQPNGKELLAELRAANIMQKAGLHDPQMAKTAELLKNPDVLNWVLRNNRPDLPSLKAAPEPGMIDNLVKQLQAWIKK